MAMLALVRVLAAQGFPEPRTRFAVAGVVKHRPNREQLTSRTDEGQRIREKLRQFRQIRDCWCLCRQGQSRRRAKRRSRQPWRRVHGLCPSCVHADSPIRLQRNIHGLADILTLLCLERAVVLGPLAGLGLAPGAAVAVLALGAVLAALRLPKPSARLAHAGAVQSGPHGEMHLSLASRWMGKARGRKEIYRCGRTRQKTGE
mmetsp:Transcript_56246/g.182577  ORF Transcript_56246/g.182577 Transcript_56246/m.182577 type:complete len:202 (+) Transcript_56246:1136-1741(+)